MIKRTLRCWRSRCLVLLAAAWVVTTLGCAAGGAHPSTGDVGSIVVRYPADTVSARGFVPEESLDVAEYEIEGTGPAGSTFSAAMQPDGSTTEISDLPVGEWTVTISALNADGYQVGSGTHTVTVRPGERSEVALTVQDRTVAGGVRVEVTYGDTVDNAVLTADLYASGSTTPVPLAGSVPGEGSVALESAAIIPGYYELHLNLTYGDWGQWRTVSTVRIAAELQTSATLSVPDEDLSAGSVEFEVTLLGGFPVQFDFDYRVEGRRRLPDGSWPAAFDVLSEGVVAGGDTPRLIAIADLQPGTWEFWLTATSPDGGGSDWIGRVNPTSPDPHVRIPAAAAIAVPVVLDGFNMFTAVSE
jgi:hypothetical protein